MKNLGSILRARASARLLLVVIISILAAVSFTATALMKNNDVRQAKTNAKDQPNGDPTSDLWQDVSSAPAVHAGQQVPPEPRRFRSLTLNRSAMERLLAGAPREFPASARQASFTLSLPAPGGAFQRFAVWESTVMEPGLAEK